MMLVAVDCIIFGLKDNRLCVLLYRRGFEPCKGEWSLLGGFVNKNESVDSAARRVLTTLTGLNDVYMQQLGAFGAVNREPDRRVVSVAYYALLNVSERNTSVGSVSDNAVWVAVDSLPPLVFDHQEMIDMALAALRRDIKATPLVFELLPEMFSLTHMQTLYETIYGYPLDKRNFRKRVGTMPEVIDTGLIDKTGSRRGARLFTYRKQSPPTPENRPSHKPSTIS